MPVFEFACKHGLATERTYAIGQAPREIEIEHEDEPEDDDDDSRRREIVRCLAHRIFGSFYYAEDRRHMRRGLSPATGRPYAQSRTEERVIEKTMGIEFVGRGDMPDQWKRCRDYSRHLRTGGKPVDPESLNPTPKSEKGWFKKELDKRGFRFGA